MKGSKPASNRDGSPVFDHCKDSLKETQDGSWGKLKHEFMGVAASGAVVGGITSLLMNTRAYMEGELGVKELLKTVARDAAAGGATAGTSYLHREGLHVYNYNYMPVAHDGCCEGIRTEGSQ